MPTRPRHEALARRPLSPSPRARAARRVAVFTGWLGCALAVAPAAVSAAGVHTQNFEVRSDSEPAAQLVAERAEELRAALSREWLGEELPAWTQRCLVRVNTGAERLAGDTTYTLVPGRVVRWQMVLNGPLERIMETLLPHEVLHTILASHFRDAVPRWADEGAALSVEAEADRRRLWAQAGPQLLRGTHLPLSRLFAREQYPTDRDELRAFYVQGAAVTEFLLLAGKPRFLQFVQAGMQRGWEQAAADHYGFSDVASLEAAWLHWLRNDRPAVVLKDRQPLADALIALPGSEHRLAATAVQDQLVTTPVGQ